MRALLLALALAVSLAGCKKGGRSGVGLDLPRYPGATYYVHERLEAPGAIIFRAQLDTPDALRTVTEWYDEALEAVPGWRKEVSFSRETIWTTRNMSWEGALKAKVFDPRKRGAMLIIADMGMKTQILLFESVPAP